MLIMPVLESERLVIRPFVMEDLEAIHQILDIDLAYANDDNEMLNGLEERKQWLEWTVRNYVQLARLNQPPFGDRAVVLKTSGRLIGAIGFAPNLDPHGQLYYDPTRPGDSVERSFTLEIGLFYAFATPDQGQGYATEAARAMVAYAFNDLNLKRIVATTTYDNLASQGVMRRLGMRIEKNPFPEPPWFQIVGILDRKAVE